MRYDLSPPNPLQQRGVVLIIALIILLALTIIGVSGMSTTTMQSRMAANTRDRQVAFQAAEAALRAGERYVQSNTMDQSMFSTTCDLSGYNGLCDSSDPAVSYPEYWTDTGLNVWNTATRHKTYSITFAQVAAQPEYIIEYMGNVNPAGVSSSTVPTSSDPQMFRITALGTGQSPNAKVMLQSTYEKN